MLAPGWRAMIILVAGLLFYLLVGDPSVALLLVILLGYFEFRKKNRDY